MAKTRIDEFEAFLFSAAVMLGACSSSSRRQEVGDAAGGAINAAGATNVGGVTSAGGTKATGGVVGTSIGTTTGGAVAVGGKGGGDASGLGGSNATGASGAVGTSSSGDDAGQSLVAEHALAQVGFSIAMASSVLDAQMWVIEVQDGILSRSVKDVAGKTAQLPGGGSLRVDPGLSTTSQTVTITIYYDSAFTQPYVDIVAGLISPDEVVPDADSDLPPDLTWPETLTYHAVDGHTLGVLSLTQNLALATNQHAYGTGTFVPATGAPSVQFGLDCLMATSASSFPCTGGVAQDFPSLSLAIGSVTPLTLTRRGSGSKDAGAGPIDFSGSSSTVVSGPLGSLALGTPVPPTLSVSGGTAFTSTVTDGSAAEALVFFPPKPTGWTITDTAHDERFTITLIDDTTRNLAATITRVSTGATLANASLDQSGTGAITYSDGSTVAITSWTVAD